jgi:GMP synthase (glutamine-hydrolysing)
LLAYTHRKLFEKVRAAAMIDAFMAVKTSGHGKSTARTRVAILDAGGQYVDLVVKAVERLGYEAQLLPIDTAADILANDYGAVIMSGSPASSHEEAAPAPDPKLWQQDIKFLGVCYGMQAMALALGGKVEKGKQREDGRTKTKVDTTHRLFSDTKSEQVALFTHGDFVTKLADDVTPLGGHELSDGTHVYSAIARGDFVGVQFHPEVFEDTPEGYQIIRNFLQGIAGLEPDEQLVAEHTARVIAAKRATIQKRVANKQVIAFVSGGVDSTVALSLVAPEVPADDLHAYYIDSGFMRDEDNDVIGMLNRAGIGVQIIHAAEQFANANAEFEGILHGPLSSVSDPQTKRRIIGKTFIDIQNDLLKELGLEGEDVLLLQGTNAADRIESGYSTGGHTAVIKTHHNQVAEVKELEKRGLLLEPLSDLHKNEIREIGHQLKLPYDVVERQPFPGPGLAIRILCYDTDGPVIQPDIAAEITEYVHKTGGYTAQLLPIRSVGVGGDERSHLSAAALSGPADWSKLHELATAVPAAYRGQINRVVYALGDAPLTDMHTTATLLTPDVTAQLRQADAIVFEEMRRADLLTTIKQFPVVLLPLSFDGPGKRTIVLRPISSVTYLVSQALFPELDLPKDFIEIIASRIQNEVAGISQVFLDLTNKPPATTEWE